MKVAAAIAVAWMALAWGSVCSAAQPTDAPEVNSTGQQGGVTAGTINSLTQNNWPPIVAGPHLKQFQESFTSGARILRALKVKIDDTQIDALCSSTESWAGAVNSWIKKDIGDYASERFLFRHGLSFTYSVDGEPEHKAGYAQRRNNCLDALSEWLVNLDNLMRDPSIYPAR